MTNHAALPSPLITVADLRALLDSGRPLVLLDCRFDLADTEAGRRAFLQGHLPGARYLHLDEDLSGAKTSRGAIDGGRHPLPERAVLAARVGQWGITPDTTVITYDAQGGPYAARAWWLLRWLGHAAVAVLDGGLPAWVSSGSTLATGPGATGAGMPSYPTQADGMPTVTPAELLSQPANLRVLDARAPERFRGEVEPLDAQAGHIPGALNRFFKDNLDASGCFLPPATLHQVFASLGGEARQWVHQCGSGVTACHNLLAMEVAGLRGSRLYPGSWSEWSADPRRPIAKG